MPIRFGKRQMAISMTCPNKFSKERTHVKIIETKTNQDHNTS